MQHTAAGAMQHTAAGAMQHTAAGAMQHVASTATPCHLAWIIIYTPPQFPDPESAVPPPWYHPLVLGPFWAFLCLSVAVLAPSWLVLGLSWGRLGLSWGRLGPSWVRPGPSWGCSGPSWGRPGSSWAPSGRLRSSPKTPQDPQRPSKGLPQTRAAEEILETRAAMKTFTPAMLGQGQKKGGSAQYQKARQEALNRVRSCARLSLEQQNDWKFFTTTWDSRMAEAHN